MACASLNDVANVLLACGGSPIMSDEPDDVADIIVFAATRPNRVNIDFLQVTPIDQVGGAKPKK